MKQALYLMILFSAALFNQAAAQEVSLFPKGEISNTDNHTVATGDSFPTDVSHLVKADLKQVSKKNGWVFNWKSELDAPEKEL